MNGSRRTISLRNYTAAEVFHINGFVQRIVKAKTAGRDFNQDVCEWLGNISDEIHAKLAAVDLIKSRASAEEKEGIRLGAFLDTYIAKQTDVKGGTKVFYGHMIHNLRDFFGDSKLLADITIGDAHDFHRHLLQVKARQKSVEKLSAATITSVMYACKALLPASHLQRSRVIWT